MSGFIRGLIAPGLPHPLLAPDGSPAWRALRDGYDRARDALHTWGADLLVLYSTGWPSVIGHQIQADPAPEWVHVDQEWHELGSIPYTLRMDPGFAGAWRDAARARGLHARTVSYRGFPVDTGTIVALRLLDPDNRIPACVVSCNMYAERAETLVLGKAARDAVLATGRRAVAVAVTSLSSRLHTEPIDPAHDRISSLKDDEWNRKLLELLADGRLEDVSQLAREFAAQANGDSKGKALWWLAATLGQHNDYEGTVYAYQPVWGTGAALVGLAPSERAAARREFDEEDPEVHRGDRGVLSVAPGEASVSSPPAQPQAPPPREAPASSPPAPKLGAQAAHVDASNTLPPAPQAVPPHTGGVVHTDTAPRPVGAYPHARRVGDLLYLSGIGPRTPGTDAIPGGPVRDADGPRDYDVAAQTRQCIANVRAILAAAGSSLDRVVDVSVFLIDMARDFAAFNAVYGEHFASVQATRTTVEVRALPTPIAVELKVIARAGDAP